MGKLSSQRSRRGQSSVYLAVLVCWVTVLLYLAALPCTACLLWLCNCGELVISVSGGRE